MAEKPETFRQSIPGWAFFATGVLSLWVGLSDSAFERHLDKGLPAFLLYFVVGVIFALVPVVLSGTPSARRNCAAAAKGLVPLAVLLIAVSTRHIIDSGGQAWVLVGLASFTLSIAVSRWREADMG
jgi:hypothetical protein